MNLKEFHQSIRHVEFDPRSVVLDVPPELLANIAKVEAAIAAGKVTKADVKRIEAVMEKYGPALAEMREHAERKARLWWEMAGRG